MKYSCPHCNTVINLTSDSKTFMPENSKFGDPMILITVGFCLECHSPIVFMTPGTITSNKGNPYGNTIQLFPSNAALRKLSPYVPEIYARNFHEAEKVLPISPKSSATLSRYLLQMILHERLNIKKKTLEEELKELEAQREVPSTLLAALQVMRKVANFGAHPKKSTNTAEIVEIEPNEAEIMLDLLIEVFDFAFVKPAQKQAFIDMAKEKYGVEV